MLWRLDCCWMTIPDNPGTLTHMVNTAIVSLQAEDGTFQPILPQEDIAQMYQRILDTEIAVAGGDQAVSNGTASKAGSSAQNLKLAAAMGLTQLMLPFRFAAFPLAFCVVAPALSLPPLPLPPPLPWAPLPYVWPLPSTFAAFLLVSCVLQPLLKPLVYLSSQSSC